MNHKEEMDVAFENCLTYLRRRGRLPFRAASFGPVDNLILSLCAYDPFEWVLGGRAVCGCPFPMPWKS